MGAEVLCLIVVALASAWCSAGSGTCRRRIALGVPSRKAFGQIQSYPSEPLLMDAARIAFAFDRTVWDSLHVAPAVLGTRARLPVVWLEAAL